MGDTLNNFFIVNLKNNFIPFLILLAHCLAADGRTGPGPPSQVDSERIFSVAALVLFDNRKNLEPEKATKLIVIEQFLVNKH